MSLYEILIKDDVIKSINENITEILELIPELKNLIGFEHKHPHHHLDVWNHTLLALSKSTIDFDVRLVLLLHDIGKPFSYQEIDGLRHYNGHSKVSSDMAYNILKRLGYDEKYIEKICFFINNHDYPITKKFIKNNYLDALKLYEIQKCDALAHHPDKLEKRKEYLKQISSNL